MTVCFFYQFNIFELKFYLQLPFNVLKLMTGGFEDRVSVILIEICKFRDFFALVLLDNKELYFFSQTGTIVPFNE